MLDLGLELRGRQDPRILCLGAHSDDLEIGACATILALSQAYPSARITWVVFGATGPREQEARASAEYCTRAFGTSKIFVHGFRDGFFDADVGAVKEAFEELKSETEPPDLVFTHYRNDLHQDHRAISALTWQTFRNHLIFEYEIPKYDGDFGSPNVFCSVSPEIHAEKLAVLERYFESQRNRAWFKAETFTAVMRLRGIECNSDSGLAEAFYCRKACLGIG